MPVLLDQRIEKAFTLDADAMPSGKEVITAVSTSTQEVNQDMKSKQLLQRVAEQPQEIDNPQSATPNPVIAFSYFNPPIPADVLIREKRLIFLRTQYFSGHVKKYSGVWKANSKWWDKSWKAQEWDVEIENHGVYRLCRVNNDWFLAGEYD